MNPKNIMTLNNKGVSQKLEYYVPNTYVDLFNRQIGNTCGLCAANYVVNSLALSPTVKQLETNESTLVKLALDYTPTEWRRKLTQIGEILHPAEFAAFLSEKASIITATAEKFNTDRIKEVINSDGYVLVPFGVDNKGFPIESGGPHWCAIAGYREAAGKLAFLSKHWAQNYDFDAAALEASNANPLTFGTVLTYGVGCSAVEDYHNAHPSQLYKSQTKQYTFKKEDLNASRQLEGQMITIFKK